MNWLREIRRGQEHILTGLTSLPFRNGLKPIPRIKIPIHNARNEVSRKGRKEVSRKGPAKKFHAKGPQRSFTQRLAKRFHAKARKEVSRKGSQRGFTQRPANKFHAKTRKEVSRKGSQRGFTQRPAKRFHAKARKEVLRKVYHALHLFDLDIPEINRITMVLEGNMAFG